MPFCIRTPSTHPPRPPLPKTEPRLTFLEREKRGLLKKRRDREWAEVREKDQEIKGPESSAPASAALKQVLDQTVAGKLSADQVTPKPSLPSGGFVKGMCLADNSTVQKSSPSYSRVPNSFSSLFTSEGALRPRDHPPWGYSSSQRCPFPKVEGTILEEEQHSHTSKYP